MNRQLILAMTALMAFGTHAFAGDKKSDQPSGDKRCLPLTQISDTNVIDNKTILFKMNNGKIYRNVLPYSCPGLGFNQSFAYKTSLSVLCDLDTITVLESDNRLGATCGLGKFEPYTPPKKDKEKK